MSADEAHTPQPPIHFEQALASLEEAVHDLEEGQLDLNVALRRYEDGIRLLGLCYRLLEKAERKVELLSGVDANGQPVADPWRDERTSLEEKADARSARRTASAPQSSTANADPAEDGGGAADGDETGRLF